MTTAYTRQTRGTLDQVKSHVQRQFEATVQVGLSPGALDAYAAALGAVVEAGQLVVGDLTSAHLANEFDIKPLPVSRRITQRESGIDKTEVYKRPYRVVEQRVRAGANIDEAVAAGSRRLDGLAHVDMEMAKIRQAQQILIAAKRKTYRRQTTSEKPCDLCQIASTQVYYTADLLPIHDWCYCEVIADDTGGDQDQADKDFQVPPALDQVKIINELIEKGAEPAEFRDLIAVREHGEVGPMLTWKGQHFTGPDSLPNPVVLDAKGRVLQRKGRPLSLEEVDRRNAQDRAGYRARATEKRELAGKPEPRYAKEILATRAEAEAIVDSLEGERIARLGASKTPWSDAEYALEDNPKCTPAQRLKARELAEDIYQRSAAIEPAITSSVQATVQAQNGFMSGLNFRLKEGPSLYRKIQKVALDDGVTVEQAAADIKDAVRYTGVIAPEGYWQGGNQLREVLKTLGAKTVKDPVGLPLEGYRGRNMCFEYHGAFFELQVHTELAVALKEECHELYDIWRKLDRESPEAIKLFDEMQTKWDSIPIMEGTPVVPTDRDVKDLKKILYVAKDSKYRGRTVPGGEAEIGGPEMLKRERVPSSQYGMDYFPGRDKVVAAARTVDEIGWDTLPVETIPYGTPIHANEASLKKASIDKVVKGTEPFRKGYVAKLWRDEKGELHVVDGHHRVAMHHALGLDMDARIMDAETYRAIREAETLETERLARLATEHPTPWSDEQYAVEDNPKLSEEKRHQARVLAEDIYRRSFAIEEQITQAVQETVQGQGGFMSGLKFRLKEGPSLYRKIQKVALDDGISVRQAAADIKDAVRYTGVIEPEGYWAGGNQLRDVLVSLGARVIKDPVGLPLEGYRGRNMCFEFHGAFFELQVHTELAVALKEECHELYDIWRKLPRDSDEAVALFNEMQAKWDSIPITAGTPVVPTDRDVKDFKKILYVATDSKYRGPTVPGGEAEIGGPEMLKRERVPTTQYGMDYFPGRAEIVAEARSVPNALWDTMPVEHVKLGTPIHGNEASLKKASIDKVVKGSEPFRKGYVAKLWRDDKGELHVVDGHHRVAMHHALGLDMDAHIMDQATYEALVAKAGGPEAMSVMMAEQQAAEAAKEAVKQAAKDTAAQPKTIALPSDNDNDTANINFYWTSNFDMGKEALRAGAEEARRSGYVGLPKLKAWEQDKFYSSDEGRKTIGAEIYSRIVHAPDVTAKPLFRGVTLNADDLAGMQEGVSISLPLSSFGYHDAALKYMRGEYGFVSADREGRDIPVIIRLEPGARVAKIQEPNMLEESVTTGQFEIVSVKDNPNGYKEITIRQKSVTG